MACQAGVGRWQDLTFLLLEYFGIYWKILENVGRSRKNIENIENIVMLGRGWSLARPHSSPLRAQPGPRWPRMVDAPGVAPLVDQ